MKVDQAGDGLDDFHHRQHLVFLDLVPTMNHSTANVQHLRARLFQHRADGTSSNEGFDIGLKTSLISDDIDHDEFEHGPHAHGRDVVCFDLDGRKHLVVEVEEAGRDVSIEIVTDRPMWLRQRRNGRRSLDVDEFKRIRLCFVDLNSHCIGDSLTATTLDDGVVIEAVDLVALVHAVPVL